MVAGVQGLSAAVLCRSLWRWWRWGGGQEHPRDLDRREAGRKEILAKKFSPLTTTCVVQQQHAAALLPPLFF